MLTKHRVSTLSLFSVCGLLMFGLAAKAQTNPLGLVGQVPSTLQRGQTIVLNGWAQAGIAGARTSVIQANLLFDPAYFTVAFTPANIPGASVMIVRNTQATFVVPSGPMAGTRTARYYTAGLVNAVTGKGAAQIQGAFAFGTYTLTVRPNAPAGTTYFGFTDSLVASSLMKTANRSLVLTTPSANTSFPSGIVTIRSAAY